MVTACMHDGSAGSAVLQDDNVIGKQKAKTSKMVLVCQGVCRHVCVCVCVSGTLRDICRPSVGCPFTVPHCLSYKKQITWVRNYQRGDSSHCSVL